MAEDIYSTLKNAQFEFENHNFKRAEELYSSYISSCLQSSNCEASHLSTAYNNRGQIKYLRVDFHEAIDDYTSAIQTDNTFEIPFYNRGLIHYRLDISGDPTLGPDSKVYNFPSFVGFFEEAQSDFKQALKLKPDFEDAKVSLQQTLLDQQEKITRGY